VTRHRSLSTSFTWLFAATLLLLYGVAATAIWENARARARQYALLTLKAEGESVAGYLATTGRLDAPEFRAPEVTPFPIWFRLLQGKRVLAQTPGSPVLPVKRTGPIKHEVVTEWSPTIRGPYLTLYHEVGGALEGAILQLIAPTSSLDLRQERLGAVLLLAGLLVIPLAALGGSRSARCVRSTSWSPAFARSTRVVSETAFTFPPGSSKKSPWSLGPSTICWIVSRPAWRPCVASRPTPPTRSAIP